MISLDNKNHTLSLFTRMLYIGALYCDYNLRQGGFNGEGYRSGAVIAVKTHSRSWSKYVYNDTMTTTITAVPKSVAPRRVVMTNMEAFCYRMAKRHHMVKQGIKIKASSDIGNDQHVYITVQAYDEDVN